jgi:anti-anti-sigma regulatory factor
MNARLKDGSLRLRLGRQFDVTESERLAETVRSFAPLSQLTLDFNEVRSFEDSACGVLARTLSASCVRNVVLLGLTARESRMLKFLGVKYTHLQLVAK